MNTVKLLIVALFTFSSGVFIAQEDDDNLVKNPGFEGVDKKLKKQGQIDKAEFWSSPTPESADLFTAKKAALPISIPDNVYGSEEAKEGKHYAGFIAYSYGGKALRSYLTAELTGTLEKDAMYCVKYHVSLADLSKYAVNNLSAFMTKKVPTRTEKEDIILEKQSDIDNLVFHPTNKKFDARYNWEPVCGVYTAKGKEKFLVIGNFKDNKETKYQKLKKLKETRGAQQAYAYYYVDEVSVTKISSPNECECKISKMDVEDRQTIIYRKTVSAEGALSLKQKVENSTIYFDLLNAKIDPSMIGDLDRLVALMKANPNLMLEAKGHVDNEEKIKAGTDPSFQDLDGDRIEAVIEYLTDKGIARSRFSTNPMQASELVDTDETELAKAKNRRVEFIIK